MIKEREKKKPVSGSSSSGARAFLCPHCGQEHPFYMTRCPDNGIEVDEVYKMAGQMLEGKYRIGDMIAEGGMGVVYEAEHTKIGRKLAVKFLMKNITANPLMLKRFQNEARIAASVGHRNIVDILDMGTTPRKIPYIVMEYLDGSDLGDVIDAVTRLPPPLAAELAIQILGALRAVHLKGIVHRDLKPENVFIVRETGGGMIVKILDFGISRLQQRDKVGQDLTRTGAVFGTPRYMSPEQARGLKDIDHRADIYSVGVILYKMITGVTPFEQEDYNNLIIAITTEEPLPVSSHGVPVDPRLEAIVMQALARDPAERFEDADSLMRALHPFRSSAMEEVDPTSSTDSGPLSALEGSPGGTPAELISQAVKRVSTPGSRPGTPENSLEDATVSSEEILTGSSPPARGVTSSSPAVGDSHTMGGMEIVAGSEDEEPASARGRGVMIFGSIILAMVVLGVVAVLLWKKVNGADDVGAVPIEQAVEPESFTIDLDGIPPGAEVYVDDVLHAERPVTVEPSDAVKRIRIEADGFWNWEKRVAIIGDVTFTVNMNPLDAEPKNLAVEEGDDDEKDKVRSPKKASKKASKKPGKKKRDEPKSEKKPVEKKKSEIDTSYPGI
jgi:serine/threonine-protein kinase